MIFYLASLFVLQVLASTTTYNVSVANLGGANDTANINFRFVGTNAADTTINPTLRANVGDVLIFNVSGLNTGDNFAIHTSNSPGAGNVDRLAGVTPITGDTLLTLTITNSTLQTLYYVSEKVGNTNATGEIIITTNCSDVPTPTGGSGGNCVANAVNGTTCVPVCGTGFTGTLSAVCVTGTYQVTGTCTAVTVPTPAPSPAPTPAPTPSGTGPSPSPSPSNNEVTYIFVIEGTSTRNCNYVNDTVVGNLNDFLNTEADNNNINTNAELTDCNNDNSGSSFTITVTIRGQDSDVSDVIVNGDAFGAVIRSQLEQDPSVTITNVDVNEEGSGFFMQASLISLLAVVLTAISA